jgi:hypothetical protein
MGWGRRRRRRRGRGSGVDYSGDDTADALLDALRSNPKPDPPYTLPLINDLTMELEALQEDSADDDGAEGREGK